MYCQCQCLWSLAQWQNESVTVNLFFKIKCNDLLLWTYSPKTQSHSITVTHKLQHAPGDTRIPFPVHELPLLSSAWFSTLVKLVTCMFNKQGFTVVLTTNCSIFNHRKDSKFIVPSIQHWKVKCIKLNSYVCVCFVVVVFSHYNYYNYKP